MISVIRVSRSGDEAIVKSSSGYTIISENSNDIVEGEFPALLASGSWRRPVDEDNERFAEKAKIVEGAIVASVADDDQKERTYRAPKSVREEINLALREFSALIPDSDRDIARRIASGPVSKADIEWMHTFFLQVEKAEKLRGGPKGARWASRILNPEVPMTASTNPLSDDLYYYGIGDNPNGTHVQGLLAVDPAGELVLEYRDGEFIEVIGDNLSDIDEPYVMPLDGETAAAVANWINEAPGDNTLGYDVYNHDVLERNLVELAMSELDLDGLDFYGSLVADATGYSPVERSVNAKRQPRAPGGKFGGGGPKPAGETLGAFAKARLDKELPLINPAERIAEWLSEGVVASAKRFSLDDLIAGTVTFAVEDEEVAAPTEPTAAPETPATDNALYFAIVDEVDKTAVLEAIAIRKNDSGQPEAFLRKEGAWVNDPATLKNLQGATPPPVVELDGTDTVKQVLSQIDQHDGAPKTEEIDQTSSEQIKNLSGFSLPDGSLPIYSSDDVSAAVESVSLTASAGEIAHIRKRAKALNRIDLLPVEWRTATAADRGTELSRSKLYGEFGEIIVAAGVPGVADTPSDYAAAARLKNYWTRGKGALKIRWGTPGDLTRAHRHLAKYVGNDRAWGLANSYHKAVFGVSNITHDRATGQYKPRRRKR